MEQGITVAIAHSPDRGRAIKELAERNESFLSLCTDLADADAALRRWKISPLPVRDIRCAEYEELVRDLAVEIGVELDHRSHGPPRACTRTGITCN